MNVPDVKSFHLWMDFLATIKLISAHRTNQKLHLYVCGAHLLMKATFWFEECRGYISEGDESCLPWHQTHCSTLSWWFSYSFAKTDWSPATFESNILMMSTLQDKTQSTQICVLCWLWSIAWICSFKTWNSTWSHYDLGNPWLAFTFILVTDTETSREGKLSKEVHSKLC